MSDFEEIHCPCRHKNRYDRYSSSLDCEEMGMSAEVIGLEGVDRCRVCKLFHESARLSSWSQGPIYNM